VPIFQSIELLTTENNRFYLGDVDIDYKELLLPEFRR
jgi:hypothetical protein